MTVDGHKLNFAYDVDGKPAYVVYDGTKYFYLTNLQGDVVAIADRNGNILVEYTYDAWGNILTITGSMASTLGKYNPLRYRGYVYDQESSLYYLQSRYYDPALGRFLNSDVLVSTGQGLLGNNMFAYCRNNAVCRIDISGTEDAVAYDDEELLSSQDLEQHASGGGGGSTWSAFLDTLQSAADGLTMASGQKCLPGTEKHHVLSNKNSKYTPQYKEITDRYNMSLDQQENIVALEGHKGRHTNAYHDFMLSGLREIDTIAAGNVEAFYEGFMVLVDFLKENSWLPYAK